MLSVSECLNASFRLSFTLHQKLTNYNINSLDHKPPLSFVCTAANAEKSWLMAFRQYTVYKNNNTIKFNFKVNRLYGGNIRDEGLCLY